MWKLWVIVAGLFLILESITTGFLVFWFGIGALIAMVVSLFTSNIAIQTAVFVFSSCLAASGVSVSHCILALWAFSVEVVVFPKSQSILSDIGFSPHLHDPALNLFPLVIRHCVNNIRGLSQHIHCSRLTS